MEITRDMAMVSLLGMMDLHIQDTGKIIRLMDMVKGYFLMEMYMKVIGITIK